MAERVGKEQIKREKGYLYYLGKDGYLWKTPTLLNVDGKKQRVSTEKYVRQDGYMYFIDKMGFVSRAKMRMSEEGSRGPVCDSGPHELAVGEPLELLLDIRRGERLRGRLFEVNSQDFDWAIVNQKNSILAREGSAYNYEKGEDGTTGDQVRWKVPRDGPWYLFLAIPYRRNPRSVRVEFAREASSD